MSLSSSISLFLLLCLYSTSQAYAQSTSTSSISISVPTAAPNGAFQVSPSLVSLSIEGDRWSEWAGSDSPNTFFINVLSNLKTYTGTPPMLRVGGDSEDNTNFDPSATSDEDVYPPASPTNIFPEASSVVVGPSYYASSQYMPSGTQMIWGVNFGTDNTTAATLEAESILGAFQSSAVKNANVSLHLLEIGNEPDRYVLTKRRPSSYDFKAYVAEWSAFVAQVSSAAGFSGANSPGLMGLSLGHITTAGFTTQNGLSGGLLQTSAGKLITTMSQHHYQGSTTSGTARIGDLMDKKLIRGNLTAFSDDITATRKAGLKYDLGETNTYSGHGILNISNSAASAIWLVDYSLQAATLGVERLFFHNGIGYAYNLIQPVALNKSLSGIPLQTPLAAHVQPAYYGALVVAEFLGNSSSRTITELSTSSDTLAGYALYTPSGLSSVVLINSAPFLSSTSGSRPITSVNLGLAGMTMNVKRLDIGRTDDTSGLSWGGQSFETVAGTPGGTLSTLNVSADQSINVSASEVVLLKFT
ncbi:hypothetical protein SISSUDRAFT_978381 [Sistotremastrum suecicum HHB10207 ss-3]|uniref:Beta-glucuronidase C-terminal domain-containing protein n=1 Tax=Sistotremastrum suecicum HHB10207 ss-3 TaxID=1314776 RepID=A0A166I0Q5_9AGAM|nr:hypothetical protein SISSUDRAFT_978381 [Sistotremastrum suecicum HHB10207 ss-3]